MSTKVADLVTSKILASLASGTVPWHRPWKVSGLEHQNLFTHREYSGINTLLCSLSGFATPYWATFKQIAAHNGRIRTGEKSTLIVFWLFTKPKTEAEAKGFRTIPMLRYYLVWNYSQLENLENYLPETQAPAPASDPSGYAAAGTLASRYLSDSGPSLFHGSDRAYYSPSVDHVTMPEFAKFDSPSAYYLTLFHELAHSTGHPSRLDRDTLKKIKSFDNHAYSREELVAELASCMMANHAGLTPDYTQSASYISGWSRALKDDPMAIITAASRADTATQYILGLHVPDAATAQESAAMAC